MKQNKEKIIELHNNGLNYSEIGEIFSVSRQRIHQIIKNYRPDKPYIKYRLNLCEICGFKEKYASSLIVHHLDGNHKNNEKHNLMTLCSQCHTEIHRMKL